MFPTSVFNQASIGFPFPGQQLSASLYQSQLAGFAGFNPQVVTHFQQAPPPPRGQSLPASGRQYPPPTSTYVPPPLSSSSRRQKHSQHPPPASSQHYGQRSRHGSKSKKHHKRQSLSPSALVEQGLYSDHEQQHHEQSQEQQLRSRSHSPVLATHSKQEGTGNIDHHQQQSELAEGTHNDATQGGVARSEEAQADVESNKQKSSSKKKKHHRREHHDTYSIPPPQSVLLDTNLYQQPYQSQQFTQHQTYVGEYHSELPPQLKVHRQPLYTGYNQAYEESIRRGDVSRKYAKRSTRLPPEAKQQLFPHEDDQKSQPPLVQQQQQQAYPFGPTNSGYPQQPFSGIRPPFNPYQPYGVQQVPPNYYGSTPGSAPFNALQPWSNINATYGSSEQEVQHLRQRIRTLEGEIYKLQRKLHKTTLNKNEATEGQDNYNQDEMIRSHHRSKPTSSGSPRETPVIVELNNTTSEAFHDSSSKKHRHRTPSTMSSQHEQQHFQQDSTTGITSGQNQNQPTSDAHQFTQIDDHQTLEVEPRSSISKNTREETAAQLAHAAAARFNSRQGFVDIPPQQQAPVPAPVPTQIPPVVPAPASVPAPPPPVPQVGRTQLNSQQQQFIYQQGVLPPQGQQIRGPPPRFPAVGNIIYPGDPYQQQQQQQQQFINPHQRVLPNQNYNQSNNNELFDDDEEEDERRQQEKQNRSAEKILDAFERFYINRGKPTTVPMKVKYIPEDNNSNQKYSNYYHQRKTNNNNRYRSTSRRSRSSTSSSESIYSNSPSFSRRSLYDNNHRKSQKIFSLKAMWFFTNIIFLFLQINIFLQADDSDCHTPSMIDFVRDSLPKICFDSDSAGFLNYSMDNVEFYNAHCRIYQDIKQCLETKLKNCDVVRPGFNRHILNLIESYQLPLEYFDYDAKVYDDNHYLQNLIPFCDGNKLSNHFLQQFDRSLLNCLTKTTLTKHKECLRTFKQNIQIILQTKASLNEITKWSEDFLRCIYNSIPTNCPTATKEVFVFKELLAVPDKHDLATPTSLNITKIVRQKLPSQNVEGFAQSKRATSSIHGISIY
ncbi:unnamed protein product [Rotaria sp. Silwood2]|nr:unnamed protein product [Rotaria sp. Silwood2]CAF4244767.1 unnamed protein product [Rotaria sp. Silwood2]